MKRYNAIQAVGLSLFSASFYRDVGQNWRGVGFGYLFLLLAVLWIPGMVQMHGWVTRFVHKDAPAFINQIPPITISHGQVSAECSMPYVIKEPGGNEPLVIIDTTGGTTSLGDRHTAALLTKTKLIVRQGLNDTRVYDLSTVEDFHLDRNRVQHWAEMTGQWLATVCYPFVLIGSFIYRMVQALIYALIGLLFARLLNITLGYAALVRLSVFALTPVLILCTVQELAQVPLTGWWIVCLAVAMVYLFVAVKANAGPPPVPPVEPPPQPTITG